MELDSISRSMYDTTNSNRRRPTAPQRLEEIRNGLCFYCKEQGHIAVNCPKKTKPISENYVDRR
jgi:hypothetical protein